MGKVSLRVVSSASSKASSAKDSKDQIISTPWACNHHKDGSDIDAYIDALGEWMSIAKAPSGLPVNAKTVAEHIVRAVNAYEKNQDLMAEMGAALEACLECDGLNWAAEHDAELTLERYKSLTKAK